MTNGTSISHVGAIRRNVNLRRAEALRRRRRRALCNTVLEALATLGLAVCFVLCAVMMSCLG